MSLPAISQINASVDELDRRFRAIKIDQDNREDYLLGTQVRPALGAMSPEVADLFLKSPEGKMLFCVIKQLIKCKRLSDKTPREFFDRMNASLKDGSCYGEAQAVMLSRRPKVIVDSKERRFQEFVDAIFFQVQHELQFFQKDDLKLQMKGLCDLTKQLNTKGKNTTKKLANLQMHKERLEQCIRALGKCQNKDAKKVKKAKKLQALRKQVKTLNTQINKAEDKRTQCNAKLLKIRGKIARICKKVHKLDDFQSQVDQEVKNKWAEKKLVIFKETSISHDKDKESRDSFFLRLGKRLTDVLRNRSASDFLLTFSYDDEASGLHTILVQPTHPRLYDSNDGEMAYTSLADIVLDLSLYCEMNDINCIDVQHIKEA